VQTALIGSPETIRQRVAAYEEAGVQELLLRFVDGINLEALRRFAQEFIPCTAYEWRTRSPLATRYDQRVL